MSAQNSAYFCLAERLRICRFDVFLFWIRFEFYACVWVFFRMLLVVLHSLRVPRLITRILHSFFSFFFRIYTKFRSITYILELPLSILSTALILASILQFYHTGIFYGSIRAWGVYLFVGLKFILFLFNRQQIQWNILEQESLHTQDKHSHPNRS